MAHIQKRIDHLTTAIEAFDSACSTHFALKERFKRATKGTFLYEDAFAPNALST